MYDGVHPSADAVAALIRSEHGLRYFLAFIGQARPAWLRAVILYMRTITARRLQNAAARVLQEAIDADQDVQKDIAETESFLVECGESLAGDGTPSLLPISRAPGRAMASARSR
jgi:hypothetical protein